MALAPPAVPCADVTIVNHSFESPAIPADSFSTTQAPTGWTAYGSVDFGWRTIGVVNPNTTLLYLDPVPHGSNVGVTFFGPSFGNSPAGMFQTLSTTLQGRTRYTLLVEVGNMAYVTSPPHNAFNFTGFPGYRIDLLAGSSTVASDNNTLLPGEGRFLTSTVMLATASSDTNIGQLLGIWLVNLDAAAGIEVNFDDVRLDATPIPDPVIAMTNLADGTLRIDFTDGLDESGDLASWTRVDPAPASPFVVEPTNATRFYRASE